MLGYFGKSQPTEKQLAREMKTTKSGTADAPLMAALGRRGLAVKHVRKMTIADLSRSVRRGLPVIVAFQAWSDLHFAAVIGVDGAYVYLEDPRLRGRVRGYVPRGEFAKRWLRSGILAWNPQAPAVLERVAEWARPIPP